VTALATWRASKDGQPLATLRAVETLAGCRVEIELAHGTAPAPYVCSAPRDALGFLSEAVETLTVLGCELTQG
jgi:hypothetical protein